MWINAKGKIQIDNGVRIITNIDICKYYQWFINKYHYNTVKSQLPKYKAHITVINPKIHNIDNFEKVLDYNEKDVEFQYNVDMHISKVNFWLPVKCDIEKEIKNKLNIVDNERYWGLHLTIANNKFQ